MIFTLLNSWSLWLEFECANIQSLKSSINSLFCMDSSDSIIASACLQCGRSKSKLTKRKDEIGYFLPEINRNKRHPSKKQQSPEVSPRFDPTKERIIISIASENQPSPAYERAQQLCSSPNLRAESASSNVYTRLSSPIYWTQLKTMRLLLTSNNNTANGTNNL